MISMNEVAKMIFDEDQKAGRDIDRPKSYITQRWVELNRVNLEQRTKEHAQFLSEVAEIAAIKKSQPKTKNRIDAEQAILDFLSDKNDFVSVMKVVCATGLSRSFCGAILLEMFETGVLDCTGGGRGFQTKYQIANKQVAA